MYYHAPLSLYLDFKHDKALHQCMKHFVRRAFYVKSKQLFLQKPFLQSMNQRKSALSIGNIQRIPAACIHKTIRNMHWNFDHKGGWIGGFLIMNTWDFDCSEIFFLWDLQAFSLFCFLFLRHKKKQNRRCTARVQAYKKKLS